MQKFKTGTKVYLRDEYFDTQKNGDYPRVKNQRVGIITGFHKYELDTIGTYGYEDLVDGSLEKYQVRVGKGIKNGVDCHNEYVIEKHLDKLDDK